MKNYFKSIALLFGLISISFFQSCSFDDCHETLKYQIYQPVYKTTEEMRLIEISDAIPLENSGKIYVYGKYLIVGELFKGIHIFDNSDPSNPVNLSFISIPGNVDMAVKSSILYADNFIDLISFDISDPANPKYLSRVENVFHNNISEVNGQGYIVYYEATDQIVEQDCSTNYGGYYYEDASGTLGLDVTNGGVKNEGSATNVGSITGVGGSMARFTILKDRLYTVDKRDLNVFDVTVPENPSKVNEIALGWGIETIYPFKENLFIGSNSGMFIYSVTDPDNPKYLSQFTHASACDPVFVSGNTAYVTLRTGNSCNGIKNQMDVINIENITTPKLIKTYIFDNPHGLSIFNDKLVLCEGDYGLKVLEISDPLKIETKTKYSSPHSYDVIILGENDVIVVGNYGLYQYKFDGFELSLLSKIEKTN